ncbi:MAG: sulfite exporter TauE/SafE family protein [Deltaproteobacteria bacterium]|nr:sulfite exporter TauE/SafE family protein [Deltaproteobacteria bacterium]
MLRLLLLLFTGLAAGTVGALLGLGGGIVLVPVLTLGFGVQARLAVGTSLVGVIATSAGVGTVSTEGGRADVPLALRLEIASTAGAMAGGLVGGIMSPRALSILFAIVIFATAVYTVIKSRHQTDEALATRDYTPKRWILGYAIASVAGMLSGLLGIGGGFVKVPTMYAIMGIPLGVATATSNFMVGITAAASLFVYLVRGDIRPVLTAITASGVFLGAIGGAFLKTRISVVLLRWALVILMMVVGVQILWKGF